MTPYSPWCSLGTDIFAPYPQTTDLWGVAQAMDYQPLCPSDNLKYTTNNQDIPATTKLSGQPQGLPIPILTTPSTPILLSQSQHIMGCNQQKYYAPHCLTPVTPTYPDPITDQMIQMMTQNIQSHKQLMWLIL